jgi:DNA polymerase III sliding clamp (beta) subunit (PCNA family)
MKISKNELIKALDVIKPGLSNSESLEQSTSFAFIEDHIVTYNDSISISIPFESGIQGAVSAKELYNFLHKLADDALNMSVSDGELKISVSKKEKAGIKIIKKIELPLDEIKSDQKWQKIPKNLIAALHFCSFSTSKDLKNPLLSCIHVDGGTVESTDNFRATSYILDGAVKKEFLIPAAAVKFLKDFKATKYNATKSWVNFISKEKAIFSCRVFTQEYPNISKILKSRGKKVEFPDGIKDAIEKAVVFCEKEEGTTGTMIDVTLKKNLIMIKGRGSAGWYTNKTKTKYIGDSFTFSISSDFFLDMLKITNHCFLDKDSKKLSFGTKEWSHIVLLMVEDD